MPSPTRRGGSPPLPDGEAVLLDDCGRLPAGGGGRRPGEGTRRDVPFL